MNNCPVENCDHTTSTIMCGEHWGHLPNDMKSKLIWLHPDVAKHRKTPTKAGAYEALLRTCVAFLRHRETLTK